MMPMQKKRKYTKESAVPLLTEAVRGIRAAFASDKQNNPHTHDYEMIFSFYQNLLHRKGITDIRKDILQILDMYCYSPSTGRHAGGSALSADPRC